MRVVIPSDHRNEGAEIYPFFGQARYFHLYEVEKGEFRLLEIRENSASGSIRELGHGERPLRVQQIIDKYLSDCDLFVAVNMNKNIISKLEARGKKVAFVPGGQVGELVGKIAKENPGRALPASRGRK